MAAGDPVEVENSCFLLTETSKYLLDTFKVVLNGFVGAAIGGGDEGGGVASELAGINFPEKGRITSGAFAAV